MHGSMTKTNLFTTDAAPPREHARVPLDMAWESAWWARQYAGTTADAWRAYFEGRGTRPRGDWSTPTPRAGASADSGIVYPVREQRRAA